MVIVEGWIAFPMVSEARASTLDWLTRAVAVDGREKRKKGSSRPGTGISGDALCTTAFNAPALGSVREEEKVGRTAAPEWDRMAAAAPRIVRNGCGRMEHGSTAAWPKEGLERKRARTARERDGGGEGVNAEC